MSGSLTPEQDWFSVGGAESGHISVHPHPDSAHIVWAGNYIGQIDRSNLETGESRNMILYPQMGDGVAPRDALYRFQWNAPILISRHDPQVVYHTSQYVHRTTDGGMSWETISPDLTTDNEAWQDLPGGPLQHDHTGVEVYTTVFTLSESHQDGAELWAGTDDGRVHITRDGGDTWTEITPDDMPAGGTVNSIDLSPTIPGRAVMAVYRYREGDFRPYVFLTEDWGEDWELLTDGRNGIPADHPVRVVREDPDRPGLLYAGTEFGMFVSFDEGERWQPLQQNLPRTPITDLKVHRGDLVVATQGRSFWILDGVTPLHALRDAVRTGERDPVRGEALHLFEPRDVTLARFGIGGDRAPENAPNGVVLDFWVGEGVDEVEIEIVDASGTVIREFEGTVAGEGAAGGGSGDSAAAGADPGDEAGADDEAEEDDAPEDPYLEEEELEVEPGMNRFTWDLRYPGPDVIPTARFSLANTGGMWATPGTYTIRVEAEGAGLEDDRSGAAGSSGRGDDGLLREVRVAVDPDPRIPTVVPADLQARFQLTSQVRERLSTVHDAVREIRAIREQSRDVMERLENGGYGEALVAELREMADGMNEALAEVEEALIQTRSESGQDPINFPPMLDDQLAYLYSHVNGSYGRPTEGAYRRHEDLVAETQPLLDRLEAVVADELAAFNAALEEAGLGGVIARRR